MVVCATTSTVGPKTPAAQHVRSRAAKEVGMRTALWRARHANPQRTFYRSLAATGVALLDCSHKFPAWRKGLLSDIAVAAPGVAWPACGRVGNLALPSLAGAQTVYDIDAAVYEQVQLMAAEAAEATQLVATSRMLDQPVYICPKNYRAEFTGSKNVSFPCGTRVTVLARKDVATTPNTVVYAGVVNLGTEDFMLKVVPNSGHGFDQHARSGECRGALSVADTAALRLQVRKICVRPGFAAFFDTSMVTGDDHIGQQLMPGTFLSAKDQLASGHLLKRVAFWLKLARASSNGGPTPDTIVQRWNNGIGAGKFPPQLSGATTDLCTVPKGSTRVQMFRAQFPAGIDTSWVPVDPALAANYPPERRTIYEMDSTIASTVGTSAAAAAAGAAGGDKTSDSKGGDRDGGSEDESESDDDWSVGDDE